MKSIELGAPNNSGPQCIFAPELVDTTSPEHKTRNRDYTPESPERQEIDIYVDDGPIVKRIDQPENSEDRVGQRPAPWHQRFDSNPEVPHPHGLIGPVTNHKVTSEVAKSHVSVATFDGKGSERRSIDNMRSIRSSQMNSPGRNNIKNVFRKSNARESHKPLPVSNTDAQDYL